MASDPRDYRLDLSSGTAPAGGQPSQAVGRPFISVNFACCKVYQRIYRDADGRGYSGRCPRCGRTIYFPVGPGGTDSRSFVVR